jgi:signal transduction histidine kinase
MKENEGKKKEFAERKIFAELPQDTWDELTRAVEHRVLAPRTIIFRQGDPGDSFYVIRSGKVRVFRRDSDGFETELSVLGAGESFGEMALVTGEARSANVEAMEETHLIVLSKEQFERILRDFPDISLTFVKQMSGWLMRADRAIEAEMEIMRLNGELQQRVLDLRNANDELEAFNSMVSHDLRSPLMVIRWYSEMIAKDYSKVLDEEFVDQMGMIQASALKMEQLIDDLLAYSRLGKQALQRAPVPMNELVASIEEELRTIYPGGEVTISPLASCVGDERMVRQVFTNLLSNALKFSSHRTERMIEIGCVEQTSENVYFVKDNGAGFDMQHKDKLFNVFQRLHSQEEFGGTGMGLAIVKRIVSLHGGTVWAEGKADGGATFYVTLPRVSEASQAG